MSGPVVTREILERILDGYERGLTQREIGAEVGINERTVNSAICRERAAGNLRAAKMAPEVVAERRRQSLARSGLLYRARRVVPVPKWVATAGLRADYLSYAAMFGEEAAASQCRKLKRDMTAGYAG